MFTNPEDYSRCTDDPEFLERMEDIDRQKAQYDAISYAESMKIDGQQSSQYKSAQRMLDNIYKKMGDLTDIWEAERRANLRRG
ncbi:hypothetical protein [Novipirellula rosea]|uniref:ABC transporter Uup C-terminal domain-containing protein n=1 Tax=Novipirellula rosea TaxID=1031540 RepID=A0ABP8M4L3_9BACT